MPPQQQEQEHVLLQDPLGGCKLQCSSEPGRATTTTTSSSISTPWGTWATAGPRWIWDSGMTCSFLASAIFSFSGLCVKLTTGRVPVLEVCFIRSALSFGLTQLLMQAIGMPARQFFGQRPNLKLLLLRGCCGACSMTTYYIALFLLPLADAVTINVVGPPVTVLFARLLLKEPLGYRGAAGCVVSLAGVLLVARPPFLFGGHEEWARSRAIGTAAGIVSAVLGGGSSITIRLIAASEPAAVIALWFHTATMALSVVPLFAGLPDKPQLLSPHDGGLMAAVAATSFAAQLLSTRGLQRCQAAKAASLGFTQVVYSSIMGVFFFNERLTLGGCAGASLILAGVLLVTMRARPAAGSNSSTPASASEACSKLDDGVGLLLAAEPAAAGGVSDVAVPPGAVVIIRLPSSRAAAGMRAASFDSSKPCRDEPAEGAAAGAVGAEERGHLAALFAASAAAALGGELCPAGSAASALGLSRQVSTMSAAQSTGASQLSRQPSQWTSIGASRFINTTVLGLDVLTGLQPADEQQPPGVAIGGSPALQQALLCPPQQQLRSTSVSRRRSSNTGGDAGQGVVGPIRAGSRLLSAS